MLTTDYEGEAHRLRLLGRQPIKGLAAATLSVDEHPKVNFEHNRSATAVKTRVQRHLPAGGKENADGGPPQPLRPDLLAPNHHLLAYQRAAESQVEVQRCKEAALQAYVNLVKERASAKAAEARLQKLRAAEQERHTRERIRRARTAAPHSPVARAAGRSFAQHHAASTSPIDSRQASPACPAELGQKVQEDHTGARPVTTSTAPSTPNAGLRDSLHGGARGDGKHADYSLSPRNAAQQHEPSSNGVPVQGAPKSGKSPSAPMGACPAVSMQQQAPLSLPSSSSSAKPLQSGDQAETQELLLDSGIQRNGSHQATGSDKEQRRHGSGEQAPPDHTPAHALTGEACSVVVQPSLIARQRLLLHAGQSVQHPSRGQLTATAAAVAVGGALANAMPHAAPACDSRSTPAPAVRVVPHAHKSQAGSLIERQGGKAGAAGITAPGQQGHAFSLGDQAGLARIIAKVCDLGLTIPPLCSCNNADPLDARYTHKCCKNCRLHGNTHAHEMLLGALLRNASVL